MAEPLTRELILAQARKFAVLAVKTNQANAIALDHEKSRNDLWVTITSTHAAVLFVAAIFAAPDVFAEK